MTAVSPLSDIRVVDFGQAITGPICATFLADLGADVVKIERPDGEVYRTDRREKNGEPFNPPFELYNRNKRSLCIDLKSDEGHEVAEDLIADADVLIQNWPPGVAERLELDYDTVQEYNEDIVYVHVTGFGESGPGSEKPAMDTIVQHMSGFSSLLGYEDDTPIRSQSSLVDFYAGYNAAVATLGAIRHRDNGNGGQKVTVSMLDSMMHNMDGAFEYYNNLGENLPKGGSNGFFEPDMLYGAAEANDGYICVALMLYSDRIWHAVCDLLDRPDLLEKEKYQTDTGRMDDAGKLSGLFEDWLETKTVEEALEELSDVGIPATKHNSIEEAATLPQVQHRELFKEIDHPRLGQIMLTDVPFDLSESPATLDRHAPMLGEHNREVLQEMGYSFDEIDSLESKDVLEVGNDGEDSG